jgi:tetratricopeptide (TPR) repeat protein
MHRAPAPSVARTRPKWPAAAALAGVAIAAFYPALSSGFVNLDDSIYVTQTPPVTRGLSGEGILWAFTTFAAGNWHPLTWLSLQLDASLWGPGPWGFHLTNVLLHAANAALLFLALRSLTGGFWRSAAAALLFAVHPLRAESVAWVSERKDVLSALFGLLALLAYAGYARAPSAGRYLLVAGALALSLSAKPMLVTLPCLLLVLDWWPLARARTAGNWGKLAAEKLPLMALAAASAALTYQAQADQGAVGSIRALPPAVRLENATVGYVAYLAKTVWPFGLAVYYPHPARIDSMGGGLPPGEVAGAALLLVTLTAGAVAVRRRAPYLLAGWLWYLGTLVPVIGLVQVGSQAYADRYTYLPQVGLLLAVCWGVGDLARSRPRVALATAAVVAALLFTLTQAQVRVWHDSATLWEHALSVTPETPEALVRLGDAYKQERRDAKAEARYRAALRIDPEFVEALNNLGTLLHRQGRPADAAPFLEEACRVAPRFALAHTNLGNALHDLGRLDEAARAHEKAIELAPRLSEAHANLGLVEEARHNYARAAKCYEQALSLRPDFQPAHAGLTRILSARAQRGAPLPPAPPRNGRR